MTVTAAHLTAKLDNLPDDVLGIIFGQLKLEELVGLRSVGRHLSDRVSSLGIPLYLSTHRQSHLTLSPSHSKWQPIELVKYNHYINQSLTQHRFHALQIGPTWQQSVIPSLELTSDKVIVGVGNKVLIHPLVHLHRNQNDEIEGRYERGGKVIDRSLEYDLNHIQTTNGNGIRKSYQGGKSDIIGILPIPPSTSTSSSSSTKDDYIIAQFDGTIQRVSLPTPQPEEPEFKGQNGYGKFRLHPHPQSQAKVKAKYSNPHFTESINTLIGTYDGSQFMTTSISGKVNLYSTKSPWSEPSSIQLRTPRAWSSLLSNDKYGNSIGSAAILGIQGGIEIHPISQTGSFLPLPSSSSSSSSSSNNVRARKLIGPEVPLLSSPYDLQFPPISPEGEFLSSHNPNLLLSGWYDSHLRIHDLRFPSHLPILQFSDPYTWADGSAFYSTCFIGEYHLAGGGSKHGTVSFFDIRHHKTSLSSNTANGESKRKGKPGWSCFSPGGKGSPVYKLKPDNGKILGVTEKRLFELSFDASGNHFQGLITDKLKDSMNNQLSNHRNRDRDRYKSTPSGWKGRGGKWSWTVNYDKDESKGAVGYEHRDRGIELFDSLVAV